MCDCYFATQLLEPICETKHGTGKVLDFHKNYEENGGRKKEKEKKSRKKRAFFFIAATTRIMYGHIGCFAWLLAATEAAHCCCFLHLIQVPPAFQTEDQDL